MSRRDGCCHRSWDPIWGYRNDRHSCCCHDRHGYGHDDGGMQVIGELVVGLLALVAAVAIAVARRPFLALGLLVVAAGVALALALPH